MSLKSFFEGWESKENEPPKTHAEEWREKRHTSRVELGQSGGLQFYFRAGTKLDQCEGVVANASLSGCRFKVEAEAALLPTIGSSVNGILVVEGEEVPLLTEIVRVQKSGEVAVRFRPPFPKELNRLERFLEPRNLGKSLKEIDREKLQNVQDQHLRWFQGKNDTHLFSWTDASGKNIVQQQLVFLQKVVEWNGDRVRTGHIRADSPSDVSGYGWVKTELLDFSPSPEAEVINQARSVIESAEIESQIKQAFLGKLA